MRTIIPILVAGFTAFNAAALAQAPTAPPNEPSPLGEDEAEEAEPGNTSVAAAARLRAIVRRIDPTATFNDNGAEFRVSAVPVLLVYDINADRMRLMTPVEDADNIDAERMKRLMQANFDSALDARYALARGVLWATFLHELSSIGDQEFAKALGQTVNLVATYGKSYSSGLFVFGGGDSQEEQRKLIEELEEKAQEI